MGFEAEISNRFDECRAIIPSAAQPYQEARLPSIPVFGTTLASVALIAAAVCLPGHAVAQGPSGSQSIEIPLTPARWSIQPDAPRTPDDTARFETHLGRPSLLLPGGFASANGIDLRNGTIDADVATYPKGAFFGVAFHVESPDKYENLFFRPGASGTIQYSPSWYNMNAWQFYPGSEYTANPDIPTDRWIHVRLVIKGLEATVYIDSATTPTLVVSNLAQGGTSGTIGFWAVGGGGYLSNVRYQPDPVRYPLKPTRSVLPGAITEGWSISEAFQVATVDPGTYPDIKSLRWEPVKAEREGVVMIGRYRKDPRVYPVSAPPEYPVKPTPIPGTEVVFARTTIHADQAAVRKMWIGYSDDVVVYLNGRPLYSGLNARSSREPSYYGWFYPFADAVYLPLQKGPNELVLAVSETFGGWGFLCAFDH